MPPPMKTRSTIAVLACLQFLTGGLVSLGQAGEASTAPEEHGVLAQALAPEATLRYDYDFPMALEGDAGDYSMHEFRAFAPLPPVLTDTFVMVASLNYRVFGADFNTDVLSGTYDLNSVRLPVQMGWLAPTSPWVGIMYLEPGIATDFHVINGDSLDLNAGIGAGYRLSPDLFVALGAGYSRNYGDDDVFPGVVVLWHPSEQFTLTVSPDGIVPEWRFNDDWRLRLKMELIGGRWTMEDDAANARVVRLKGATASLVIEHRVFKQCWLAIGGSINTLASLRIDDGTGSELLDSDLEEGFALRSGLKWVF